MPEPRSVWCGVGDHVFLLLMSLKSDREAGSSEVAIWSSCNSSYLSRRLCMVSSIIADSILGVSTFLGTVSRYIGTYSRI